MATRNVLLALYLAAVLAAVPVADAAADSGAAEPLTGNGTDVAGWRGLHWGMLAAQAVAFFGADEVQRREAIEVAGCYFSNAVPIELKGETWEAWLCEERESGAVTAVSLEKGFGDTFFDDDRQTQLYETFLVEFTERYGPAHEFWQYCHNARWNATVQHRWFFPTTTVSLLLRDAADGWVSIRFEQPNDLPNYGPGVCVTPPRDLRG